MRAKHHERGGATQSPLTNHWLPFFYHPNHRLLTTGYPSFTTPPTGYWLLATDY